MSKFVSAIKELFVFTFFILKLRENFFQSTEKPLVQYKHFRRAIKIHWLRSCQCLGGCYRNLCEDCFLLCVCRSPWNTQEKMLISAKKESIKTALPHKLNGLYLWVANCLVFLKKCVYFIPLWEKGPNISFDILHAVCDEIRSMWL